MSKHDLDLLIEAARFLKPLLGELVFVGGSTTALLITDKAAADVRPPTMWMPSPKLPHTPRTQIFRNDSANVVSLRMLVKANERANPFEPLLHYSSVEPVGKRSNLHL